MSKIKPWNWELPGWPVFSYDTCGQVSFEAEFLKKGGEFAGAIRHVPDGEKNELIVALIIDEAMHTSEIEGEYLDRLSVQASVREHFGLGAGTQKIPPMEAGISSMMVELYRNYQAPLTHELLGQWHQLLMKGRRDVTEVGRYRTGGDPMQVVSGALHDPKVHFEAPPSDRIPEEMERFIQWYQATGPAGRQPLPCLTRAGLAHYYLVSIHPFEDGNGRIGRALVEKVLAEGLGQGTLISLSQIIFRQKKEYYHNLQLNNHSLDLTSWLGYFSRVILEGQALAQSLLGFLISKTKFHDRLRGQLNDRQEKVLARLFRAGPLGFEGGLSAEKYIRLTGASRATATRDLQALVAMGALSQTGTLKSTRYHLIL